MIGYIRFTKDHWEQRCRRSSLRWWRRPTIGASRTAGADAQPKLVAPLDLRATYAGE